MSSIFLFTGENAFALSEEKRRWVSEFREKHGEVNLLRLDAKSVTLRTLLDEVSVLPFIAEKRLVIIDGIPDFEREDLLSLEKQMHPQVLLLFIDPKPDRRTAVVKELLKRATVKNFPHLAGAKLAAWIDVTVRSQGASITPEARNLLLQMVGEDEMILFQELTKCSLFISGRAIGASDVIDLIMIGGEQVVWKLVDFIGAGKRREALQFARGILERGEDPVGLWNRLLWMVSSLTLVVAALREGKSHPGAIVESTELKFPTVRGLLPLAQKITDTHLSSLVRDMVSADLALKTGEHRATVEAPYEINALIDRCILQCCLA